MHFDVLGRSLGDKEERQVGGLVRKRVNIYDLSFSIKAKKSRDMLGFTFDSSPNSQFV